MADRQNDRGRWIRLAADYANDERIMRVGVTAELLFVRHLATSRRLRSDGHLTTEQLRLITHDIERRTAKRALDALIREGLLEACHDGLRVPFDRWCRWQDTEAELDDARERGRARKAEWRARQRDQRF